MWNHLHPAELMVETRKMMSVVSANAPKHLFRWQCPHVAVEDRRSLVGWMGQQNCSFPVSYQQPTVFYVFKHGSNLKSARRRCWSHAVLLLDQCYSKMSLYSTVTPSEGRERLLSCTLTPVKHTWSYSALPVCAEPLPPVLYVLEHIVLWQPAWKHHTRLQTAAPPSLPLRHKANQIWAIHVFLCCVKWWMK